MKISSSEFIKKLHKELNGVEFKTYEEANKKWEKIIDCMGKLGFKKTSDMTYGEIHEIQWKKVLDFEHKDEQDFFQSLNMWKTIDHDKECIRFTIKCCLRQSMYAKVLKPIWLF